MHAGEMRDRITLCEIITPSGGYQIFNPTMDDVKPMAEVWAKREDRAALGRWNMIDLNLMERRQFIIRYRRDLPRDMAIIWNGEVMKVFATPDLDGKRQWTMLLAGKLGVYRDDEI